MVKLPSRLDKLVHIRRFIIWHRQKTWVTTSDWTSVRSNLSKNDSEGIFGFGVRVLGVIHEVLAIVLPADQLMYLRVVYLNLTDVFQ